MSAVLKLVLKEPWRIGQGQHVNALDPSWSNIERPLCNGEIEWEGTSRWWWCRACGYCGCWTVTHHHPIVHPLDQLMNSLQAFTQRRQDEGLTHDEALNQALHVAGVALRYAATMPADKLGDYVRDHLTVK